MSTEDIARVAFHVLTDEGHHNDEYHITGPQLLAYDQVSEFLSFFSPHSLEVPEVEL